MGTAPAAGTAGDKASTEEEDQANSLNELATVLTNTHNMLTAAVQRHRTEAATSPKRNQNQQRKRDAKPRLSYEEILKHLQFGMFVKPTAVLHYNDTNGLASLGLLYHIYVHVLQCLSY